MTYLSNKGCYGSVICNDPKSKVCRDCALFDACHQLKKENLHKIKESNAVGVSLYERRMFQHEVETSTTSESVIVTSSTREKLTNYQQKLLNDERFPVKTRKLAGSLFRKGISGNYLKNLMLKKVNPFKDSTPVILEITCDLIINNQLTLTSLRRALTYAGQKDKTALAQSHTVIKTFMLMGVLDGTLKLRK